MALGPSEHNQIKFHQINKDNLVKINWHSDWRVVSVPYPWFIWATLILLRGMPTAAISQLILQSWGPTGQQLWPAIQVRKVLMQTVTPMKYLYCTVPYVTPYVCLYIILIALIWNLRQRQHLGSLSFGGRLRTVHILILLGSGSIRGWIPGGNTAFVAAQQDDYNKNPSYARVIKYFHNKLFEFSSVICLHQKKPDNRGEKTSNQAF